MTFRWIMGAVVASLIVAYFLNNANHIPDLIFWAFPAWVWVHMNYYLTLSAACFIVVGLPIIGVGVLVRRERST